MKFLTAHNIQTLGFTLIELLIALSIIAAAGIIAIPSLRKQDDYEGLHYTTRSLLENLQRGHTYSQTRVHCGQTASPAPATNKALLWRYEIKIDTHGLYTARMSCSGLLTSDISEAPFYFSPNVTVDQPVDFIYKDLSGSVTRCPVNLPVLIQFNNTNNSITFGDATCNSNPVTVDSEDNQPDEIEIKIESSKLPATDYALIHITKGGSIYVEFKP